MSCDQFYYDAFISYRHLELSARTAVRLQRFLESYRSPCNGTFVKKGRRIPRIFTDKSEMPLSADLGTTIRDALARARFFIVLATPEYSQSLWCMEELRYFVQLHGGSIDNVLFVLVDGSPEGSILQLLRLLDAGASSPIAEPLFADLRSAGGRLSQKQQRQEYLRIAAPIIGCGYDDLYRRQRRRRIKKAALCTLFILLLAAAGLLARQKYLTDMRELTQQKQAAVQLQQLEKQLADIHSQIQAQDRLAALQSIHQLWSQYGDQPEYAGLIEQSLDPVWMSANYCSAFTTLKTVSCGQTLTTCLSSDDSRLLTVDLVVGDYTHVQIYDRLLNPIAACELDYLLTSWVEIVDVDSYVSPTTEVIRLDYDSAAEQIVLTDANGSHYFDHSGALVRETPPQPAPDRPDGSKLGLRDRPWFSAESGSLYFLAEPDFAFGADTQFDPFAAAALYRLAPGSTSPQLLTAVEAPITPIFAWEDMVLTPDERYALLISCRGIYEAHVRIFDLERGVFLQDTTLDSYVIGSDFHFDLYHIGRQITVKTYNGTTVFSLQPAGRQPDNRSFPVQEAASMSVAADGLCYITDHSGSLYLICSRNLNLADELSGQPAPLVSTSPQDNALLPSGSDPTLSVQEASLETAGLLLRSAAVPRSTGTAFVAGGWDMAFSAADPDGTQLFCFVCPTGYAHPYYSTADRIFGFADYEQAVSVEQFRLYSFREFADLLAQCFAQQPASTTG